MADDRMLSQVDVSRLARPFRLVRLANYFMIVGGGTWLIGQLVNAPNLTWEWLPLVGFVWLGLIVNLWAGLTTAGIIDGRMWRRLYIALPLLAVCCAVAAVSLYRSMPADIDPNTNPSGNAIFVACFLSALFAVSGVLALVALLVLDRVRLEPGALRLRDIVAAVERRAEPRPANARRAGPTSLWKGLACAALAAMLLIAPHYVPDAIWQPHAQILSLLSLSGWSFLFHARRYFLPGAGALLAADTRSQTVLLRSFVDDERHAYLRAELSVVDFGLETRLAHHFGRFGPFVAIGAAKQPTPRPGASTIKLGNDEWQAVVLGWMDGSRGIVLLAGTTYWVSWELSQVLERGHHGKLIVMFPRTRRWRFWRRAQAEQARLAKLRETLAATRWAAALAGIERPQDVRALVLRENGSVLLVMSRPRSRDSYHLALLVAHRDLLESKSGLTTL